MPDHARLPCPRCDGPLGQLPHSRQAHRDLQPVLRSGRTDFHQLESSGTILAWTIPLAFPRIRHRAKMGTCCDGSSSGAGELAASWGAIDAGGRNGLVDTRRTEVTPARPSSLAADREDVARSPAG